MTLPDIASVTTLAGRELDAAVHRFVMGQRQEWHEWGASAVPCYSTDPAAFFAMVEAVRAKGWAIAMHLDGVATVRLMKWPNETGERTVRGDAHTLPLAFARAALLTCYTPHKGE